MCVHVRVSDLQGAVQEAAVLSRLVAKAFAGRDGGHGSRGHQPLSPAQRRHSPSSPSSSSAATAATS